MNARRREFSGGDSTWTLKIAFRNHQLVLGSAAGVERRRPSSHRETGAGEPPIPRGVQSAEPPCMLSFVMSWLAWLGLAVIITAVAAVTGIKPKGTRHVAHTRLMGVARLALLALVIIFAYLAFRARSGQSSDRPTISTFSHPPAVGARTGAAPSR